MRLAGICWTYLGPPDQWVTALAETEWGLFVGTRDSGVFRLNAATGEWEPLGLAHAIVSSLVFVRVPVPRLMAGMIPRGEEQTEAAVFVTEDAGATWKPWDGGLAARLGFRSWAHSLASDPLLPTRLYMGQSGSILRSEDGGQSWEYVLGSENLQGLGVNSLIISEKSDRRVWAGGQTAVFAGVVRRSDDSGRTWLSYYPTPSADDAVLALALDPVAQERVWAGMLGTVKRSDDAGVTWETVLTSKNPALVAGLKFNNGTLYVATVEETGSPLSPAYLLGLYRTSNGGAGWDTLPVPQDAAGAASTAVAERGELLIGTRRGAWRVVP